MVWAQNPLQAVLCSWHRLRSCRAETCLFHSLWHWGCLGAHIFSTSWAEACSPHPNMEGFPWQLMHVWMDMWLNGTDLTYSQAQQDSVNPFTFSVFLWFHFVIGYQMLFLPLVTNLEVISLCPSYSSPSSEKLILMVTLLKGHPVEKVYHREEVRVRYSLLHNAWIPGHIGKFVKSEYIFSTSQDIWSVTEPFVSTCLSSNSCNSFMILCLNENFYL